MRDQVLASEIAKHEQFRPKNVWLIATGPSLATRHSVEV